MSAPLRFAFCDESLSIQAGSDGVYVLSAAVFDIGQLDDARDMLRSLVAKGGRFHWHDESSAVRRKATAMVAAIPAIHTVVVAKSMNSKKQERARALCLERLLWLLEQDGVLDVALESRPESLNRADLNMVNRLRARHVIAPGGLRVEHVRPSIEPLLWAADLLAGACREFYDGRSECRLLLDDVVVEHVLDLR